MEAVRHRERHLEGFLKGVPIADGANQLELRDWLERVTIAFEFIPGLEVDEAKRELAKAASGSLLDAIRAYTPQPQQASLLGLAAHLRAACVSQLEGDRRITEVETYKQAACQSVQEYVAQFRVKVNRAYTAEDLGNAKISRSLIKGFINGLYNERTRFDTAAANLENVEMAFLAAIAADARAAWIRQDTRMEEPMDLGPLPPPPAELLTAPVPPPQPKQAGTVSETLDQVVSRVVSRQLSGVQKQIARLQGENSQQPERGRQSSKRREDDQAAPPRMTRLPSNARTQRQQDPSLVVCYHCGNVGHYRSECRKLARERLVVHTAQHAPAPRDRGQLTTTERRAPLRHHLN